MFHSDRFPVLLNEAGFALPGADGPARTRFHPDRQWAALTAAANELADALFYLEDA